MNPNSFVSDLGQVLGRDLKLSDDGDLAFDFEGRGLLLQWREQTEAFLFYVEIGPLVGWRDGEVCRRLLSANFLLAETSGATLSYDSIRNQVGLNYLLPLFGRSSGDFLRVLDNLMETASLWQERLIDLGSEQEMLVTASDGFSSDQNLGTEGVVSTFLQV